MFWVVSLAVLPNGKMVSCSHDCTLKLWNTNSGVCERTLGGRSLEVLCVVLLADGRVASGSDDTQIKIWNLDTGVCERTLGDHSGSVEALAVLPDGRLVSCSADKTIKVWNTTSYTCEHTLQAHSDWIVSLAVYEGRLLSYDRSCTLKAWSLDSFSLLETRENAVMPIVVQNPRYKISFSASSITVHDTWVDDRLRLLLLGRNKSTGFLSALPTPLFRQIAARLVEVVRLE
eukprot:GILI01040381.1.p1 GENE.GILI01040381.1~~GILI01040381.1.p1  ORF type:complete len:257 (+),score=-2.50 GILI01040381.1:79-771(+)